MHYIKEHDPIKRISRQKYTTYDTPSRPTEQTNLTTHASDGSRGNVQSVT